MAGTRFKLSVMMFLEFFIWGAWYPLVFGYLPSLGFTAWEQTLILGAHERQDRMAFLRRGEDRRHFADAGQ